MNPIMISAIVMIAIPQEGPTKEVVQHVKNATVYLVVERQRGNLVEQHHGTGFVARRNGKRATIVTNRHIIEFNDNGQANAPNPNAIAPNIDLSVGLDGDVPGRNPKIAVEATVYFRPGTQQQAKAKGKVLFSAKATDLALIDVADVENLPAPIEINPSTKVEELNTVYFFGFPLGPQLAIAGQGPAVTVHKATISSLKQNQKGELTCVQINGEVNHGNSGGPLVNEKGKLIGVMYAKVEDTQIGMGIALPPVLSLLKPRILGILIRPRAGELGEKVKADSYVRVFLLSNEADWKNVRFISRAKELRHRTVQMELTRDPAHRAAELKIDGDVANGELLLHTPTGDESILCQVVATDLAGKVFRSNVREVSLNGGAVVLGEDLGKANGKTRKSSTKSSGLTARERLEKSRSKNVDKKLHEAKTARERLNRAKSEKDKN